MRDIQLAVLLWQKAWFLLQGHCQQWYQPQRLCNLDCLWFAVWNCEESTNNMIIVVINISEFSFKWFTIETNTGDCTRVTSVSMRSKRCVSYILWIVSFVNVTVTVVMVKSVKWVNLLRTSLDLQLNVPQEQIIKYLLEMSLSQCVNQQWSINLVLIWNILEFF